jgi:hypothetical protein
MYFGVLDGDFSEREMRVCTSIDTDTTVSLSEADTPLFGVNARNIRPRGNS